MDNKNMDLITFSDKQKALRIKQENTRKAMTALLERYRLRKRISKQRR